MTQVLLNRYMFFVGVVLSSLFCYSQGYADWNYNFLQKENAKDQINAPKFQELERSVLNYLKNSWCSEEKARLLMELVLLEKPSVCAEIGVFSGSSLLPVAAVLSYLRQGRAYAIDPWSNKEAIENYSESDPNAKWWAGLNMDQVYHSFILMCSEWKIKPYCRTLRVTSRQASYEIGQIDFLHIDGNYSEESSLEDVILFTPKVRSGGYILYSNFSWTVDGQQTRVAAFQKLLESCEIVSIIDDRNCFLLRKF